jgi:predicted ATPase
MITHLHLENFKGLKDSNDIELKPLTLLCGPNSSGKSSIIQSLLMLKQTFESQSGYGKVVLNGQFVHLGSIINLVHNKDIKNEIKIKLEVFHDTMARTMLNRGGKPLPLRASEYFFSNFYFDSKNQDFHRLSLDVEIGLKAVNKGDIWEPLVNKFNFMAKAHPSLNESINGTSIDFSFISDGNYLIQWKDLGPHPYIFYENISPPKDLKFYQCPKCGRNHRTNSQKGINHYKYYYFKSNSAKLKANFINLFPEIKRHENFDIISYPSITSLNSLKNILQMEFSNLYYIGPLREEPARRYFHEDEFVDIGIRGENAPYILSIEGKKPVPNYRFYDESLGKWIPIKDDNLENSVNRWLRYMGINEYELESKEDLIRLNLNANQNSDVKVTLADVGFGVSQILPILVEGLRIGYGQTLILEQPEIHLHPKLQMNLADFFISMILSGKNVLLETHSDHIVNRISRRILELSNENLVSKTNMLFFENIDGNPSLKTIEINPNQGIVNWPKGFFDQSAEEKRIIIQKGIEKRRTILKKETTE